jgi:hypothetical protein
MTPKQTPLIATWLLKHLGCSPNNEAVLGDLAEEYSRKGAIWYWRQVLRAIPISALREARGHKLLVVRAFVVGFVLWAIFIASDLTVSYFVPPGPQVSIDLVQALQHPIAGGWSAVLYQPVFKGFVVEHSNPVVFVLWIQILLPLLVWAMIGWIVARVDIGRYRCDLVVVFACWMAVVHLLLIGPAISHMVVTGTSHLVIPAVAYAVTSIAAILLGGSLHRPKSERAVNAA